MSCTINANVIVSINKGKDNIRRILSSLESKVRDIYIKIDLLESKDGCIGLSYVKDKALLAYILMSVFSIPNCITIDDLKPNFNGLRKVTLILSFFTYLSIIKGLRILSIISF